MRKDAQTLLRVKEILGIPLDEPIFVLRAQDRFSIEALGDYLLDATEKQPISREGLAEWCQQVMDVRTEFVNWQRENREKVKVPD